MKLNVEQLIEKLQTMPPKAEVRLQIFEPFTSHVRNVELVRRRSLEFVELDNYVEE
ncbi:MAG: hypothetical protein IJ640_10440 [Prevotella sp.]|nr:hypothetical protein [Prevotella sp.]